MLKSITTFFVFVLLSSQLQVKAQLTGTIAVPGTYADLNTAITALNTQGVGTGGVIINITAAQFAPTGGYRLGSTALNASVTSANPVIINGNNNSATSNVGTGTTVDGIFVIQGTDYVTVNGLNLVDTNTVSATTEMEWGYALVKLNSAAPFDGCQNVTIKNCTITLNKSNTGSIGIYLGNHVAANKTALVITATTDANNNNTFTDNTIQNTATGISINGYNSTVAPYSLYDQNNTVGGSTAGLGNIIRKFGNPSTTAVATYGVYVIYQNNALIQNNTINDTITGGVPNRAGSMYGIYHTTSTGSVAIITNNNVTVIQDTANTTAFYGIASDITGTASSCNISNNTISICGGKGAGKSTLINQSASLLTETINNNTFHDVLVNATGSLTFINSANTILPGGTISIQNNKMSGNISKLTATGGGPLASFNYFINVGGTTAAAGCSDTIAGNSFTNVHLDSSSTLSILMINEGNGGSALPYPVKIIHDNVISNLQGITVTSAISIGKFGGNSSVYNNTFSNIVSQNTGIFINVSGAGQNLNVYNNRADTITDLNNSTSSVSFNGFNIGTTADTLNIYRNRISNIQSVGTISTLTAFQLNNGGTVASLYNNIISDLRSPYANNINAIVGINIAGGAYCNLYYNTIYLNAPVSTASNFGVSGVYYKDAILALDMRNNIIYVNAHPIGTGMIAAVHRNTGAVGYMPPNFATTSNSNVYYVPGDANSYLYAEGDTNNLSNVFNLANDPGFNLPCSAYKVLMTPAESTSFTENNLSQVGTTLTYAPTGVSYAKSLAVTTTAPIVVTDYNNTARPAVADAGALQFTGTREDIIAPVITYTSLPATICDTTTSFQAVITDAGGINTTTGSAPRIYYKKAADSNLFGSYPADNSSTFNGWKYTEGTGVAPNFTFSIDYSKLRSAIALGDSITYFVIAQDNAGTPNVGVNMAGFAPGYCVSSVNLTAADSVLSSALANGYRIGTAPQPVITAAGASLSTGTFAAYQWYLNGHAISGATTNSITASQSGGYTVMVTGTNGCTGTSAIDSITTAVANVVANSNNIRIYPNPATSLIHIIAPINVNVSIYDVAGRVVLFQSNVQSVDIGNLANGMYLVKITDKDNVPLKLEKLVKAAQ